MRAQTATHPQRPHPGQFQPAAPPAPALLHVKAVVQPLPSAVKTSPALTLTESQVSEEGSVPTASASSPTHLSKHLGSSSNASSRPATPGNRKRLRYGYVS